MENNRRIERLGTIYGSNFYSYALHQACKALALLQAPKMLFKVFFPM